MPNAASLSAHSQGLLIRNIDDQRPADDHFKLPAFFRTEFDAALDLLELKDGNQVLTESDRAGGSAAARAALDSLSQLLRDGFNGIKAIPSTEITAGQRLAVFTAYGWAGGKVGRLGDARVIGLSRLGVHNHPEVPAAWKYSAAIVTGLTGQLAAFDANVDNANVGTREGATRERNDALDAFEGLLARARFYYCFASAEGDQTAELARIGFQPRRDPGTVDNGPDASTTPPVAPSK
jgi:hypothetical protein